MCCWVFSAKTAQQREDRFQHAKVKRQEIKEAEPHGDVDIADLDQDIDSLDLRTRGGGNEEEHQTEALNAPRIGYRDEETTNAAEPNAIPTGGQTGQQHLDTPNAIPTGGRTGQQKLDTYYCGFGYQYDANDAILDEQTPNEESVLIGRHPSLYTMEELESALKESKFWVRENISRLKLLAVGTKEYMQLRRRTMQDVSVYEQAKIEMVKRRRQMDRKRIPQEYQHYFITQSEADIKNIPDY